MSSWEQYLSEADRAVLARGRWAQCGGRGQRPALLIIDAQNYMAGVRGGEQTLYPASCGEVGWQAIDQIARLLEVARRSSVPVIFTRLIIESAIADDGGVLTRKIGNKAGEFMFFAGTHGSEIVAPLAPVSGELVIEKKRFSAFFGTPLLSHLIALGADTLVVTGGSTSNCVRATVVDGASFDFRVVVPREAVFDRIPVCHEISLFDMHRAYADVLDCTAVVDYLANLAPAGKHSMAITR
jgi:nicotinamidase-related amidase